MLRLAKKKFFIRSIRNRSRFIKSNFSKPPTLPISYVYQDLINGLGSFFGDKCQVHCFYHDDNKASMTIYFKTNTFFCFTCRKWGGPYDIIMHVKGMTFKQALEFGKYYL